VIDEMRRKRKEKKRKEKWKGKGANGADDEITFVLRRNPPRYKISHLYQVGYSVQM
jgi:hypothetical protein